MLWYVLTGLFGAFGVLCALWITVGFWLTRYRGGTVTVICPPECVEAVKRRCGFLRQLGLVQGSVLFVCGAPDMETEPERKLRQQEQEKKVDGT